MYENMDHLFTLRFKLSTGWVTIRAWDANHRDSTGHNRIDAELRQGARVIFARGDTYCATPGHCSVDGIEARELVCSLFAMKPGDTDAEYFGGYTPEQLEWAQANGEELGMLREFRFCDENGNVRKTG